MRRRGCRLTSLLSKFRLAGLVRWRGCRRRRRGRGRGESGQDDSHGLDRLLGLQARLGQDLGQAGVAVPGDVGDARAAGGLAHVGQAPVGVVDDDRAGHGGVHMQPRPHALGQARPVDDEGDRRRGLGHEPGGLGDVGVGHDGQAATGELVGQGGIAQDPDGIGGGGGGGSAHAPTVCGAVGAGRAWGVHGRTGRHT